MLIIKKMLFFTRNSFKVGEDNWCLFKPSEQYLGQKPYLNTLARHINSLLIEISGGFMADRNRPFLLYTAKKCNAGFVHLNSNSSYSIYMMKVCDNQKPRN